MEKYDLWATDLVKYHGEIMWEDRMLMRKCQGEFKATGKISEELYHKHRRVSELFEKSCKACQALKRQRDKEQCRNT